MSIGETETRLRDTLQVLATTAVTSPDAYANARSEWQRRERRRRLLTVILALLIFALADVVGLWALSNHHHTRPTPYDQPVAPGSKVGLDGVVIIP
ncbi:MULTISPECIES: hypothetical protein [unclassified Micromonospora]|uniref:hypothetical protein n=1 Tax=unclassified Micromonospora TaxID=2617518 RepID=UPI0033AE084D